MDVKFRSCTVMYRDGSETVALSEKKGRMTASFSQAEAALSFKNDRFCGTLKVKEPTLIKEFMLNCEISTDDDAEDLALLKEGFQSWSYSGALGLNDLQRKPRASFMVALQENITNWPTGKNGNHISEMFFFLGNRKTSQGLFAGQLPPFNQFVQYSVIFGKFKTHTLVIRWDMDKLFKSNESIALDELAIREGNCTETLNSYADRVGKDAKVSFIDTMRVGWCSWYYYYTKISYDIIMENLAFSEKNNILFDFFQIDDGYQSMVGDWLNLKPSFEGKMKPMAAAIKKAGYIPGLWVAPFICERKSNIFINHNEWVLKNEKGKPVSAGFNPNWSGSFYALDITHPEVLAHLQEVFRVIKNEWGFDYIKLDFMYAASLPGKRYNQSMTRAEVMKTGCEFIRKEVGKETVLLGCGMPIGQAIGYMDAMRVSCDVAPYWKVKFTESLLNSDSNLETRGALRNSLVRTFMDKRFWINDPDCLMLRTSKTKLTAPERASLYNAVMTIGGMLVTSDKMVEYGKEEMDNLTEAINVFKTTAGGKTFSPDLLKKKIPEILVNDQGFCSIFNFDDKPQVKTINIADLNLLFKKDKVTLVEHASGKRFVLSDSLSFNLEAHGSLMFKIEKAAN
ncbi:MAG: glycoside hydrolase family 36 protein [Deltaproteobacteria bacterium]